MAALHACGIGKVVMMTGDNRQTAAGRGPGRWGWTPCYAEVLPEDKAAFIRSEKAAGHTVIMVGDGVNDSPALSEADAGMAISTGAAIAREIADITIASEDLFELVTLRRLSQALMARIHRNYRFIVGFNLSLIAAGRGGPSAAHHLRPAAQHVHPGHQPEKHGGPGPGAALPYPSRAVTSAAVRDGCRARVMP